MAAVSLETICRFMSIHVLRASDFTRIFLDSSREDLTPPYDTSVFLQTFGRELGLVNDPKQRSESSIPSNLQICRKSNLKRREKTL